MRDEAAVLAAENPKGRSLETPLRTPPPKSATIGFLLESNGSVGGQVGFHSQDSTATAQPLITGPEKGTACIFTLPDTMSVDQIITVSTNTIFCF